MTGTVKSMAAEPTVGIIIAVYNSASYIRECIDSLICQTYDNIILLFIDDGSEDHSRDIIRGYMENDSRIRLYEIAHSGLSAVRNYGLERAFENGCEYVAFVDSDDWVENDLIEKQLSCALSHDADITECGSIYEYGTKAVKKPLSEKILKDKEIIEGLVYSGISNPLFNKFIRIGCFEGITFPVGMAFEDIAVMHEVYFRSRIYVSNPFHLYHYRIRENSLSHTLTFDMLYDRWAAYTRRYDFLESKGFFEDNRELHDEMLKRVAIPIARAWRWAYGDPKEIRRQHKEKRQEMTDFTRAHYPVFGKKGWDLFLRVGIFLSRFNNTFSIMVAYRLQQLVNLFKRNKTP